MVIVYGRMKLEKCNCVIAVRRFHSPNYGASLASAMPCRWLCCQAKCSGSVWRKCFASLTSYSKQRSVGLANNTPLMRAPRNEFVLLLPYLSWWPSQIRLTVIMQWINEFYRAMLLSKAWLGAVTVMDKCVTSVERDCYLLPATLMLRTRFWSNKIFDIRMQC